ncbi:hypothetical protein HID58_077486 [Brassica napus]|uniref:Uncharacterized protein n=1 Tax=Brassica napus TaxID=3708 RepID=A0ABQ7YRL0_BRANA|nr:hypothetical protein HID58_077486 [Brassica napus]
MSGNWGSCPCSGCFCPVFCIPSYERVCIQGAWTEQRFPLLRFEVSGFWSYRLAGEAAAISVVWVQKWRVPGGGL